MTIRTWLPAALLATCTIVALGCSDSPDGATAPTPPMLSVGVDPGSGATIETDKDDYMPGEIVHLTGRGWGPGEVVNLFMREEPDTHDDVSMDVVADSVGGFSVHFYDVQPHDLGVMFTLTATGRSTLRVAVVEFTDGTISMFSNLPAPGPTGSIRGYQTSSVCNPSSSFQGTTTGPVNTTAGISRFVAGSNSARIAVNNNIPGYRFSHWSVSGGPVQLVGQQFGNGSNLQAQVICITNVSAPTFTAIFVPVAGTTPIGGNVTVEPNDETTGQPAPVDLTFDNVTAAGQTTVTSGTVGQGGGPPAPNGFRLGNPPTYYDVQTTATFTGSVTLCFTYSGVSYGNESQLKLLHRENGTWTDVTRTLDTNANVICGEVTSLSPFLVAEQNAAPVVTSIALPSLPVPVGTTVTVTASFSDANPGDAHTASLTWNDGTSSAGSVLETGGIGSATGSHTYTTAGVYTVSATVDDGDLQGSRSSSDDQPAYIVVYDPSGGFVTGGGWFDSPTGACMLTACADDGSTVGKASFGFVSSYKRGATTPTGNTEFHFKAGGLQFRSTSYQWLVVAASRAQYKGIGQIDGLSDTFGFLITAVDGDKGNSADAFRIKLWKIATGTVVYDNKIGELEDSDAATAIGGGSIVIHR